MEFSHSPVLLKECVEALNIREDGVYVDGTLGGGGHAEAVCERLSPEGVFIGIDRDKAAIEAASRRLEGFACRKYFVHDNYDNILKILEELSEREGLNEALRLDGALLDLGVSSFQLDNAERGFSYMQNAPLDMRMNEEDSFSAYDVVNGYEEEELARILKDYGEERWAQRIAAFIVKDRKRNGPIEYSERLVDIIKAAIPASARREGPHPAKRSFQAIRIEVNDELGGLRRAVEAFTEALSPGGRLAIISFHSLEDRIVKEYFAKRENPCSCPPNLPVCVCGKKGDARRITRKPIEAGKEELEGNPRARSAKLRVLEKLKTIE